MEFGIQGWELGTRDWEVRSSVRVGWELGVIRCGGGWGGELAGGRKSEGGFEARRAADRSGLASMGRAGRAEAGDLGRSGLVDMGDVVLFVGDWLETTTWHK